MQLYRDEAKKKLNLQKISQKKYTSILGNSHQFSEFHTRIICESNDNVIQNVDTNHFTAHAEFPG